MTVNPGASFNLKPLEGDGNMFGVRSLLESRFHEPKHENIEVRLDSTNQFTAYRCLSTRECRNRRTDACQGPGLPSSVDSGSFD